MDTVDGIALFASVVEAGSFSEAGRRLGRRPSTVSRQVTALEDRLGARLFDRSTRSLTLTEAGRAYHRRVVRVLADLEEAAETISHLQAAPRGVLRVSAPVAFGRLQLAPAMPDFLARHPELTVDMTLTDRFVDLIEEHEDLAIRVGELADSSLIARRLAPNRRILCASADYLARHGTPVRAADLADHNCLIYRSAPGRAVWRLADGGETIDVPVSGRFYSNNAEALHAAVRGGLGIGLLATYIVGPDVAAGRLRQVLGQVHASRTTLDTAIHAVYPPGRHLSPKVRAFVDYFAALYGERPHWDDCDAARPA